MCATGFQGNLAAQNAARMLKVAISNSAGCVLPEKLPSFVLEILVLEAQRLVSRRPDQQLADGSMQLFIDALQLLVGTPDGAALNNVQRKWFNLEGEADGVRGRQLDERHTVSVCEHAAELLHLLCASRVYSVDQAGFNTLIDIERWVRTFRLGDAISTPLGIVPSWVMGGARDDGLIGYLGYFALDLSQPKDGKAVLTAEECRNLVHMNHAANNLMMGDLSRYTQRGKAACDKQPSATQQMSELQRELFLLQRDSHMSEVASRMLQARDMWQQGEDALNQRRLDFAISFFAEALKLSESDGDPFSGRWCWGEDEEPFLRYHSAIDAVLLDARDQRTILSARLVRAYALLHSCQMQPCLGELDACIDLDPSYQRAYHLQMVVRGNLNNWADSLADAERIIQLQPSGPMGYYYRAVALRNLISTREIDPSGAMQLLRRAQGSFLQFLGLASPGGRKVCQAWYDLHMLEVCSFKFRSGKPAEAERSMLDAIADQGEEAEARMLQVLREHEAKSGSSDAERVVQMWRSTRRNSLPVSWQEAALTKANAAFNSGALEKAVRGYSNIIGADELIQVCDSAVVTKALSNRAGALTKLQEYGSAERDALRVVDLKSDWVKGYLRLARAKLGRLDARGALQAIRMGQARLSSSNAELLNEARQDAERLLVSPPPVRCNPSQLSCWPSVQFQEAVIVVDGEGRGDFVSLREAVKSVRTKHVSIIILPGKYSLNWPGFFKTSAEKDRKRMKEEEGGEHSGREGSIDVIAGITAQIIGEGKVEVTIDPLDPSPGILIYSGSQSLTMENLKILHYSLPNNPSKVAHCAGAALGATLKLINCELRSTGASCYADTRSALIMSNCKVFGPGSAVLVRGSGSSLQADNCTFCHSRRTAVEIREGGRANLERCTVSSSEYSAVQLYQGGVAASLTDCTFEACGSLPSCGGLMVTCGKMTLHRCHVLNHRGDGIVIQDSEDGSAHLELISTLVFNNGGCGLAQYGGSSTITGCRVQENANVGVSVSKHYGPQSSPFHNVTLTRNHFSGNGFGGMNADIFVNGNSKRDVGGNAGRVSFVHNHAAGLVMLSTSEVCVPSEGFPASDLKQLCEQVLRRAKTHPGSLPTLFVVCGVTGKILAEAAKFKKVKRQEDLLDQLACFQHIVQTLHLPNPNLDFAAVNFHKPALTLSHERHVTAAERSPNVPPSQYTDTPGPRPLNADAPRVALEQLKECRISELASTVGHRATGRVLWGELCVRPFRMRSLQTVIADDFGAAVKLSLYNIPAALKGDWRKSFPKGIHMLLKSTAR